MAIRTWYLTAALGLLLAAAMPLAVHAQSQGPDLKKGQQRSAPAKPQGGPAVRSPPHVAPRPAMRAPAPHVAPRPGYARARSARCATTRHTCACTASDNACACAACCPASRDAGSRATSAGGAPATSTSAGRDTALGAAAYGYADATKGAIHAAAAATTAAGNHAPATTPGARFAPARGAGLARIAAGTTRATAGGNPACARTACKATRGGATRRRCITSPVG